MRGPPLPRHAMFAELVRVAKHARCDELAAQLWVTPARMDEIANALADCVVRVLLSHPELPPLRDAAARQAARRVLDGARSPLDQAALRLLDRMDAFARSREVGRDGAWAELVAVSGPLAMCLIRAERGGVAGVGDQLARVLEAVVAQQERTVSLDDARELEDTAHAIADVGRSREAAVLCAQAARAYRALNQPEDAFRNLSNGGVLRKAAGDVRGALALTEAALQLPIHDERRFLTLMNMAGTLEAIDDPGAAAAWLDAGKHAPRPASKAFCMAHSIGVMMKHDAAYGPSELPKLLAATPGVTHSELAGIVGGAGQSARQRGAPLLAQALLVMLRDHTAWNESTAPFWDLLLEHVDLRSPEGLVLCGVGWILTSLQAAPSNIDARVDAVFARCAAARGITADELRKLILPDRSQSKQRALALFDAAERQLRAMVPVDLRVI